MGIYLYYYCHDCDKRSDQMKFGEDAIGNYMGGMGFLCRHAMHGVSLIDDIGDGPTCDVDLDDELTDAKNRLPWAHGAGWADNCISVHEKNGSWVFGQATDEFDQKQIQDKCETLPRQPHTQTVLYAREAWDRPAKLEPFKPWDGKYPRAGFVDMGVTMRLGYPLTDHMGDGHPLEGKPDAKSLDEFLERFYR